jgi:hypothetical protein
MFHEQQRHWRRFEFRQETACRNNRLASCAMMYQNVLVQASSTNVRTTLSGDDLEGIDLIYQTTYPL